MNQRRFSRATWAGALLTAVAAFDCNAILGTSDPTVAQVEGGPGDATVPTSNLAPDQEIPIAPLPLPTPVPVPVPSEPDASDAGDSSTDGDAEADGDAGETVPCVNACTAHATECQPDGVAVCETVDGGCTSWVPMTACGPNQSCKLVGGAAACVCNPSICMAGGTACQGNALAMCGTDQFQCSYVVSATACPGSDICSNPAPNATCKPVCTSTCTPGQTQCADTASLQTCGVVALTGCATFQAATACPSNEACTGSSPSASCTCNNTCSAAGPICNGTSLQTCTRDGNGCLSITATTPCTTTVGNATAACISNACSFVCNSGDTLCSGLCVNELTDGNNCGGCGHSCQGGACAGGQCQPIVLASGQDSAWGMALDATNVYWVRQTSAGTVSKIPIAGGTPVVLAQNQPNPIDVAVDANSVYWTNSGTGNNDGALMKVSLNGGTPVALVTSIAPYGVTIDATNAYYTSNNQVWKVSLNGGTPTALAQSSAPFLAVGSGDLYWTANPVSFVPIAGGATGMFAADQNPYGVTVDGQSVYWTNYTGTGTVMKAPLAGGTAVTLASGLANPFLIAVDGSNAYWTTSGTNSDGAVMKVPLTGGTPVTLTTQGFPYGIAVDSTSIYWTVAYSNAGAVVKLAK